MDIEQFRAAGYRAIDRICDYFYSLHELPVVPANLKPGYLRALLPDSAPETGEKWDEVETDFQKLIMPGMTHWQHPLFFAYFPTACTFEGILGDMYASSVSNPGFNWSSSPACTELETVVMDWAAKMLGLSTVFHNSSNIGGGCLQTTASDSALVAIVAARSAYQRAFPDAKLEEMVIYTTTQTHSLGVKAGMVLGLSVRSLHVSAEDEYSLRGSTLRHALEDDQSKGRRPFVLIATIGTTSSGAIDNLPEIRAVVKDHSYLKVHVDAAWAGVALSCPEYRSICHLDDINEFADSFCTNFHKWGLVNFDASTLWVRDRKYLTEALDFTPPFLKTMDGGIDYRNWHLALGRRFRSLKLWFVLRSFGVEGFRQYIRRTIGLNQVFVKLVEGSELLKVVAAPVLALTVFRIEPRIREGVQQQELNELNQQLFRRLSARTDIYLTQTVLNGLYCIRFAVGSERSSELHVVQAYEAIMEEADMAIAEWSIT